MKTNQTFKILFWLYKSKIHNGKALIYCRITINGRVRFSISRKIKPENWLCEAERAKGQQQPLL